MHMYDIILVIYNREFGKWEKYTTGFGSRILAKVPIHVHNVHIVKKMLHIA